MKNKQINEMNLDELDEQINYYEALLKQASRQRQELEDDIHGRRKEA